MSKKRIESIAEHVYRTCILALSIDSEFETHLDIGKVIKMLVLHEFGEVVIGDITLFNNVTPKEKMEKEHVAIKEVLVDLIKKEEYFALLLKFDEKKTKEAIFAYHCDKLEDDIQAKIYQGMGYQNPLNNQEDNVVLNSQKVQQLAKKLSLTFGMNGTSRYMQMMKNLNFLLIILRKQMLKRTFFNLTCKQIC